MERNTLKAASHSKDHSDSKKLSSMTRLNVGAKDSKRALSWKATLSAIYAGFGALSLCSALAISITDTPGLLQSEFFASVAIILFALSLHAASPDQSFLKE